MSYRVTAPLVLAKDREGKTHHVYENGLIEWLSPEQASHLLSMGMVEKVGGAPAPVDPDDDLDDEPDKPKQAAPKAAWEEYAVERAPEGQRISQEEAESLTKKELIERFG